MADATPHRRVSDHDEIEHASMLENIRHMAKTIDKMSNSMDGMAVQLSKIAVHEEKLETMRQSQERAFTAIGKWEASLTEHKEENAKQHQTFNRFVWVVSGVLSTISVMWIVSGWFFIDSIKSQSEINYAVRMHIHDDKITDQESLRKILEENKQALKEK